ncbi:type II toxin-antitoxin system prevent-host-death family antitoxin [Sphingomonas sp.]|jgi:prevent-host-death family protein|uniref:type II toxin-antitoxin system Phd/YefM family antitoxin n=1 Tax=Sphingomonas sp. TaxID=28214 RepID=UPI002EDAD092
MLTVNIHDAKTRLSELIARAVKGEPFVIAKAGKPMVKVTAIDAPEAKKPQRIGAMEGMYNVPDDFDTMFQEEIEGMFYEGPIFPDENQHKDGGTPQ